MAPMRRRDARGESANAVRVVSVPTSVRAALLVLTGAVLLAAALWAGRVGPWVANPPLGGPWTEPPAPPRSNPVIPAAPAVSAAAGDRSSSFAWQVLAIVVGAIAVFVLLALILRWILRYLNSPRPVATGPLPASAALAADAALQANTDDADRADPSADGRAFDPRATAEAVIRTWSQVEEAAAAAGFDRRTSSTPTEFLDELCAHLRVHGADVAAHALLRQYHRARFDTTMLTAGAAEHARAAAEVLLEGLAADDQDDRR